MPLNIIFAVSAISLLSFFGVLTISVNKTFLNRILIFLVAFSAGALLGDVFLHLLPTIATATNFSLSSSLSILLGIIIFFLLEKFLNWQHCHDGNCHHHEQKPLAAINLIGDGLHNIIDGALIAGSFLVNPSLGIATTLAVALHEIPQEIGDLGILIYAGLSRTKALLLNFLSALMAFLGAGLAILFASFFATFLPFLIAFTAGSFIYIATADLIPELHKPTTRLASLGQFISLLLGISIMTLLLFLE